MQEAVKFDIVDPEKSDVVNPVDANSEYLCPSILVFCVLYLDVIVLFTLHAPPNQRNTPCSLSLICQVSSIFYDADSLLLNQINLSIMSIQKLPHLQRGLVKRVSICFQRKRIIRTLGSYALVWVDCLTVHMPNYRGEISI